MGRRHARDSLELLNGKRVSQSQTHVRCFPIHPDFCVSNPFRPVYASGSGGARRTNATAVWAAKHGMNLQSSTLKFDESGEPLHVQQAAQIRAFRAEWAKWEVTPASLEFRWSRSIFALMNDLDRGLLRERAGADGTRLVSSTQPPRAVFGRGYAAEPDVLIEQLRKDEAIAEADTILLTIPNQLGVAYNVHAIEAILTHIAPALGWR